VTSSRFGTRCVRFSTSRATSAAARQFRGTAASPVFRGRRYLEWVTDTPTRTRRAGLGAAALIGSLVPAVWLLVVLAVASDSSNAVAADALITASFVVLPIAIVAVLVLAIASLIVNNWIGRLLSVVALSLLVAQLVALGIAATVVL